MFVLGELKAVATHFIEMVYFAYIPIYRVL